MRGDRRPWAGGCGQHGQAMGIREPRQGRHPPEQLNSLFWTSATLRPRRPAGPEHWVKSPTVGRCLSHWESQARWQSQNRWLECRRLQGVGGDRRLTTHLGPGPEALGRSPPLSRGRGSSPWHSTDHTLTELSDTLPSNHLTHLPTQNQIICCPRETSNIKGIHRPSLLDHSPSPSPTQPPPWVTSGVAEEAELSPPPPRAPTPSQLGAVLSGASGRLTRSAAWACG